MVNCLSSTCYNSEGIIFIYFNSFWCYFFYYLAMLPNTCSHSYFLFNQFSVQFSSVTQLCPTPCDQKDHSTPGLPSITNSQSPPKLRSIESVMPSNHLILCHPLLLLPSIFPGIRVFSNESAVRIRWPKYWSFSFSISPSNEHSGLISLQSKGLSRVFSNTTVQKHQFFGTQLSSQSNFHIHT